MSGRFGFAVVGTGMAAAPHARALQALSDKVVVRGVYSRAAGRRDRFASEFGFPSAESAEKLAEDPSVDAAILITPPNARADLIKLFASRGKHILCEKPLERTVEAAEELAATCRFHGIELGIVFQHRFRAASRRLMALLADGGSGRNTSGAGRSSLVARPSLLRRAGARHARPGRRRSSDQSSHPHARLDAMFRRTGERRASSDGDDRVSRDGIGRFRLRGAQLCQRRRRRRNGDDRRFSRRGRIHCSRMRQSKRAAEGGRANSSLALRPRGDVRRRSRNRRRRRPDGVSVRLASRSDRFIRRPSRRRRDPGSFGNRLRSRFSG